MQASAGRDKPGFFRILIRLKATRRTVALFHSGASGYRAQYYNSAELGDHANRYLLDRLTPLVLRLLSRQPKRTCAAAWVARSLGDPDAKAWVHQGPWLRYATSADRHLLVSRWTREQRSSNKTRRRKALYSGLIPQGESGIDLKGGFLTLLGHPLGTLKPDRARDIHELGFT